MNSQPTDRAAFTITELMVAVVVIAVLAVVLFSASQSARRQSDRVQCISHLRQISAASISYGSDFRGAWPLNEINGDTGNLVFMESLLPYFGGIAKRGEPGFRRSPFICPAERASGPDTQYQYEGVYVVRSRGLSYAQNSYLQATAAKRKVGLRSQVSLPGELALYMDFPRHYLMESGRLLETARQAELRERHGEAANVAFADGSVRAVKLHTIPTEMPSPFWQGRSQ